MLFISSFSISVVGFLSGSILLSLLSVESFFVFFSSIGRSIVSQAEVSLFSISISLFSLISLSVELFKLLLPLSKS